MSEVQEIARKARLIHALADEFDTPARRISAGNMPIIASSSWPAEYAARQAWLGLRRIWARWINWLT